MKFVVLISQIVSVILNLPDFCFGLCYGNVQTSFCERTGLVFLVVLGSPPLSIPVTIFGKIIYFLNRTRHVCYYCIVLEGCGNAYIIHIGMTGFVQLYIILVNIFVVSSRVTTFQ